MTTQLPTSAFDYTLPPALIASQPMPQRDASRLLVIDRASGTFEHRVFGDVVSRIDPGDVLVLNETRVIPARLLGKRAGGGAAEIVLLHPVAGGDERQRTTRSNSNSDSELTTPSFPESAVMQRLAGSDEWPDTWAALVRPGAKLKAGKSVAVNESMTVEIQDVLDDGTRVVKLVTTRPIRDAIHAFGHMPLPPYIERADDSDDRERYQTVFARAEGSVAAPTAGLHFTPEVIAALRARGVSVATIVLHVGAGTFKPVECEDPSGHVMHAEWYEVTEDTASLINRTRDAGGRVWAVGTTVTRTLESVATETGRIEARSGWTRLFIRPGYVFRAVDRMITNFHLPRSTLLMLVSAFAGYDLTMRAYAEAVAERYRFFSYGDAMVIL